MEIAQLSKVLSERIVDQSLPLDDDRVLLAEEGPVQLALIVRRVRLLCLCRLLGFALKFIQFDLLGVGRALVQLLSTDLLNSKLLL